MSYGSYGGYGSFGAWGASWVRAGAAWLPTDLTSTLLQWLSIPLVSPSEVTDVSDNLTDALLVDSVCATFDGIADKLTVAGLSGSETVTSSGGTSTPTVGVGEITFTAGTCWDLVLSNGQSFPLVAGAGLLAYDITGVAHGAITVGAGGQATFWGSRQDVFHDSAIRGCTMALQVPAAGTTVFPAVADGFSLALSMRVKIPSASDCTLYESNSLALEARVNGGNTDLYYGGSILESSITVDAWTTVAPAGGVAMVTQGRIGKNSGLYQDAFEIAWFTLENNGSMSGGSVDAVTDTWYNMEFPSDSTAAIAAFTQIQYPALADLTDDVDGAGLVNVGSGVGVHNGGVFKHKQANGGDVAVFNGSTTTIDSNISTFGGGATSVYEWNIIVNDDGTDHGRFFRNATGDLGWFFRIRHDSSHFAYLQIDDGPNAIFKFITLPAGGNGWSHYKLTFDAATGKGTLTNVTTAQSTSQTVAGLIGYNLETGGNAVILPSLDGNIAYLDMIVDGSPLIEYKMGNITGTTVPNTGSGADGTATDVTVSSDSGSIYAGLSPFVNDFWSANGLTWDSLTYISHLTHISYTDNVWNKWSKVGPVCILTDIVTTDTLTEAEHASMSTWKGAGSCGNGTLPFN